MMADRLSFAAGLLLLAVGLAMLIHLDLPYLVHGGLPRLAAAGELLMAAITAFITLRSGSKT
jgi:hypothetical protein